MKIILLGNAGSGKSTLARMLMAKHSIACLSLDEVAFCGDAKRRPLKESLSAVKLFIEKNDGWVIEGCYSDIIENILPDCEELMFLNPGIETCIAHCYSRPWEPEKFVSDEKQQENLENLVSWVRTYETREDEYGLSRHRKLYESFRGGKCEYRDPTQYH